jgi:hypothetical protein
MLAATLPAARAFGRDGSPAFRAFSTAATQPSTGGSGVVAFHASMRRVEEWQRQRLALPALRAPHGREWLELVAHWRANPSAPVRFVADPRRTDLLLFDPRARRLERSERWTFPEMPLLGGVRPGNADVYAMSPPGWMLDRGWALSAEIGGVTAREGLGPAIQPSVAWVRARTEAALLLVGGRNLGGPGDAPARITVAGEAGPIASWDAAPGFFVRRVDVLPPALAGEGYVPLRVSAVAGDGSGRPVRISLEQFDLQPSGVPMFAFETGWGEPEYNPSTGRAWRWLSDRATLWVRPTGRDAALELRGESPLRYFDRAPIVRVTAAGREVARLAPAADFAETVLLPAALLDASGGIVGLETDLWFSPAQQGGADARRLSLRVYRVEVR